MSSHPLFTVPRPPSPGKPPRRSFIERLSRSSSTPAAPPHTSSSPEPSPSSMPTKPPRPSTPTSQQQQQPSSKGGKSSSSEAPSAFAFDAVARPSTRTAAAAATDTHTLSGLVRPVARGRPERLSVHGGGEEGSSPVKADRALLKARPQAGSSRDQAAAPASPAPPSPLRPPSPSKPPKPAPAERLGLAYQGLARDDRDFLEERFAKLNRLIQLTIASPSPSNGATPSAAAASSFHSQQQHRWEAVVEALSRDGADYVGRHFSVFSRCVKVACHPGFWVSAAAAGVVQVVLRLRHYSRHGHGDVWDLQLAAIHLLLALLVCLSPALHAGRWPGRALLPPHPPSSLGLLCGRPWSSSAGFGLYETLDTMTKNLVISPLLPSSPASHPHLPQQVERRSRWLTALTLLLTSLGAAGGTWLAATCMPEALLSLLASPHGHLGGDDASCADPKVVVLEAVAGLCSLLVSAGAALAATTVLQSICLCSLLLHAQGESLTSSLATYHRTAAAAPPQSPSSSTSAATAARRASEAYLLLQHLMGRCSSSLTASLLLLASLTLGSGGLLLVLLHHNHLPPTTMAAAAAASVLLLSWPLLLLAHANTFVPRLRHALTRSGPGDYESIGGRERWLAYLRSNPAYWTLPGGLAVTSFPASLLLACATTAAAAFIHRRPFY